MGAGEKRAGSEALWKAIGRAAKKRVASRQGREQARLKEKKKALGFPKAFFDICKEGESQNRFIQNNIYIKYIVVCFYESF